MTRITVLLLLLAQPALGWAGELDRRDATKAEAAELFAARDYAALEALAERYRSDFTRTPAGAMKLHYMYLGVGQIAKAADDEAWESALTAAGDWIAAYPRSPTPYLARSHLYSARGWAIRGSGWSSGVSDWDILRFKQYSRNITSRLSALQGHNPRLGAQDRAAARWRLASRPALRRGGPRIRPGDFTRAPKGPILKLVMKRREFVSSVLAAAVGGGASLRSVLAQPAQLPRTPRDYEGPYYPVAERHRTSDLLVGEPRDTVLFFAGQVVDVDGHPLAGVLVDVWQADPLGRYDHPRDRSSGERWSEFLYWGEATTDDDGRFEFRTYTPGEYGRRPPHIHYKIWREKQRLLTSQVYFARFGGARDASLTDKGELQTVRLAEDGDVRRCHLRVVV